MNDGRVAPAPMQRLLSFATITIIGFVLGRVSGLAREMVVSAHLGLTADLDAYFLALLVPTIINNIVAGGTIAAAVMPTFSGYLARGERQEFWRVASLVANFSLLLSGGLTVLGIVFAQGTVSLLGAGLALNTRALSGNLLVLMMPTLFMGAVLNLLLAVLNAFDRFSGPALIFLALNIGIISAVVLWAPEIGVYAVAWGFILGVGLQVLIQLFELRYERPTYSFIWDWNHPALSEIRRAFIPLSVLAIVQQINPLVDRAMAATLAPGSISALAYADTMLGMFSMVGVSLGIVILPSLSRMAALTDWENSARTLEASLRFLIFTMLPGTFLLIPFASQMIGLVLGRGAFDALAVDMTARALVPYGVGLIGTTGLYVIQRALNALGKNDLLLWVGVGGAGLHIALNLILMRVWAHAGIALSTSLTLTVQAAILLLFLQRLLPSIRLVPLLNFLLQCALLGLISAGLVTMLSRQFPVESGTMLWNVTGVGWAVLGGVIYWLVALRLRFPESEILYRLAQRAVRRITPSRGTVVGR